GTRRGSPAPPRARAPEGGPTDPSRLDGYARDEEQLRSDRATDRRARHVEERVDRDEARLLEQEHEARAIDERLSFLVLDHRDLAAVDLDDVAATHANASAVEIEVVARDA